MTSYQPEYLFQQVQIGKGLRPIAQHGFIAIDRGVLTLLGSDQQPIDSAPVPQISCKRTRLTQGKNLTMVLNGTKYNVSPGWGNHVAGGAALGLSGDVKATVDALVTLIAQHGGKAE